MLRLVGPEEGQQDLGDAPTTQQSTSPAPVPYVPSHTGIDWYAHLTDNVTKDAAAGIAEALSARQVAHPGAVSHKISAQALVLVTAQMHRFLVRPVQMQPTTPVEDLTAVYLAAMKRIESFGAGHADLLAARADVRWAGNKALVAQAGRASMVARAFAVTALTILLSPVTAAPPKVPVSSAAETEVTTDKAPPARGRLLAMAGPAQSVSAPRAERSRPALTRAVLLNSVLLMQTTELTVGEAGAVFSCGHDGEKTEVGSICISAPLLARTASKEDATAMVLRGVARLSGVVASRLVDLLVCRSWVISEDPSGTTLVNRQQGKVRFPGGWAELSNILQPGKRDMSVLRDVVAAGEALKWRASAGWDGGVLWTCKETKMACVRSPSITFTLSPALQVGMAAALDTGGELPSYGARILIPTLEAAIPLPKTRGTAAAMALARLLVLEFVDRAVSVVDAGGLLVTPEHWRDLAVSARLHMKALPCILAAWQAGDASTPPFIKEGVREDHWLLADAHKDDMAFILKGGCWRRDKRQENRVAGAKRWRKK